MNVSFAEDMRRIDGAVEESYGLPAAALMENAGRRSAEEAAQLIGGAAGKVLSLRAAAITAVTLLLRRDISSIWARA